MPTDPPPPLDVVVRRLRELKNSNPQLYNEAWDKLPESTQESILSYLRDNQVEGFNPGSAYPWGNSIVFQKGEHLIFSSEMGEFFSEKVSDVLWGPTQFRNPYGDKGIGILTNQRILFVAKKRGAYPLTYGVSLTDVQALNFGGVVHSGGLLGDLGLIGSKSIVILEKNGRSRVFVGKQVQDFVEPANSAIVKAKELQEAEQRKARVQIVLDFASLKGIMQNGGLVMTMFKCPNCNGSLPLPDKGEVLVCHYCNTPVRPVDIFEKIKSLIV